MNREEIIIDGKRIIKDWGYRKDTLLSKLWPSMFALTEWCSIVDGELYGAWHYSRWQKIKYKTRNYFDRRWINK